MTHFHIFDILTFNFKIKRLLNTIFYNIYQTFAECVKRKFFDARLKKLYFDKDKQSKEHISTVLVIQYFTNLNKILLSKGRKNNTF